MSEPTTTPTPRRKKSRTPRAPRTLDPEVLAIRAEAVKAVAALHTRRRSAAILKTLLDKRLAQLVDDDRHALYEALGKLITPPLPL